MTIIRAWSQLQIKASSDAGGKRTFTGIASTPSTDRMGDIVEPKGAQFKMPLALLWQHDSQQPIGWVRSARVTETGIEVQAEMASVDEPGKLKDRLDEAWQSLKSGLVRGLSIGFRALESQDIKGTWGQRFTKWDWLELSAVTIPANQDASILAIKSVDAQQLAATGRNLRSAHPPPGASGKQQQPAAGGFSFSRTQQGTAMKTLQQLTSERAEKAARMNEIGELRATEQRSLSDDERTELTTLADEVKNLDDDIMIAGAQAVSAQSARPVDGSTQRGATQSRGKSSNIIVRKTDREDDFAGQAWIRKQIARVLSIRSVMEGNFATAAQIAEYRWGKSHPALVQHIKADVAGGGTGSGEWGAELADSDTRYTGDFIKYLYGKTLFDRLPLKTVSARVHIKGQDGASSGFWVGESKSIPLTTADFSSVELLPLRVAAIAVMSNDLLRDSQPSSEMMVRDSLVEALSQKVDTTFFSTAAASSGVSPAGILNGLTANTSSGTDADGVRDDISGLVEYFDTLKYDPAGLVLVTTTTVGNQIQMLTNAFGQQEFPGMAIGGGTLRGYPVYTGHNVGAGDLIMLSPGDIWKIGDMGVMIDTNPYASITMSDAPAGASDAPTDAGTKTVSMYQTDSTAIRIIRPISFGKRRSTSVAYIGNATYGTPASV